MTTYNLNKFQIPNSLDELGYYYSLQRFPSESLANYRLRLLEEARNPSGASEYDYLKAVDRKVGFLKKPILVIELVLDVNGVPLAPYPYIEVKANTMLLYSDINDDPELVLNLLDKDDSYFLVDLVDNINGGSFFTATLTDETYEYKKSKNLLYGNNLRFIDREPLRESRSNKLRHSMILDFFASNSTVFQEDTGNPNSLENLGEYYLDKINGALISNERQSGFVTYSYLEFPYIINYTNVRGWPMSTTDLDMRIKSKLISDDTGEESHLLLNSEGGWIINQLLKIHQLSWGK